MKLGEFKRNIINLGFEEEDVFDETPSLFIDALNRARMLFYASVEKGFKKEFVKKNPDDIEDEELIEVIVSTKPPKKVDEDTTDDTEIDIDEEKTSLLQLLTAYFVWLDDDERKAVMYYNTYQEQLSMYLQRRGSVEVIGGYDI